MGNDVRPSTLPPLALDVAFGNPQRLLTLASVEDDGLGEELQVIWEIEPGATVIEKVAERLGIDEDEALTLAEAVAGLNAQAKGRRLGSIFDCPVKVKGLRWPQFRHGTGIATPHGATQWLHPPIRDGQRGKGITNEP
jgi:hypothetical protein